MRTAVVLLGLMAVSAPAWCENEARPEILVLGTYHMANPGCDLHNITADDVLSPGRQREMTQLIEVVALIDSPRDRILVVYGFGHLGWLRQDAASDTSVRLRTLADLTH